jgi:hypothetical protein
LAQEACFEQAALDELVEVVGGERAADAHGRRRLVAADPSASVRHELVEPSADRVREGAQRTEVGESGCVSALHA